MIVIILCGSHILTGRMRCSFFDFLNRIFLTCSFCHFPALCLVYQKTFSMNKKRTLKSTRHMVCLLPMKSQLAVLNLCLKRVCCVIVPRKAMQGSNICTRAHVPLTRISSHEWLLLYHSSRRVGPVLFAPNSI